MKWLHLEKWIGKKSISLSLEPCSGKIAIQHHWSLFFQALGSETKYGKDQPRPREETNSQEQPGRQSGRKTAFYLSRRDRDKPVKNFSNLQVLQIPKAVLLIHLDINIFRNHSDHLSYSNLQCWISFGLVHAAVKYFDKKLHKSSQFWVSQYPMYANRDLQWILVHRIHSCEIGNDKVQNSSSSCDWAVP